MKNQEWRRKMKTQNKFMCFLAVAAVVLFATSALANENKPSATVTIESKSVALGVGFQWGEGVLKFQGQEYKFKVKGLSVIDVGVSTISAKGAVYSLDKLEDFSGTFTSAEASIAVGGGVGAVAMKNQNGVVMQLTSTQAGLKLKLAPEGLKIQMK
jgi:hypothetical protein